MYSNKENINILTALLVKHHVRQAVVCPGSRNAPIVHNLNECPDIECYPVTDERSAGFFALGLALNEGEPSPVAICVTSGTALLNLLPAVAEAYYQHIPLVVISADRPEQWIDQLDGQTLPQPHALQGFVGKAVALPIINTQHPSPITHHPTPNTQHPTPNTQHPTHEENWYCNRLANEALLAMRFPRKVPVHINVPIAEPLFCFEEPELPDERIIRRRFSQGSHPDILQNLVKVVKEAERPMLVVGQTHADFIHTRGWQEVMKRLEKHIVVLTERLCNYSMHTVHFDEVLHAVGNNELYQPDVVVSIGGTLVSKRLKKFLREGNARVYLLSEDGALTDTFMHLSEVVVCQPEEALMSLATQMTEEANQRLPFVERWNAALHHAELAAKTFSPAFSQMQVVKAFEESLAHANYLYKVHYANSTAIRLANIYAHQPVYCNRGVNGIEGSLSTAVGMAAHREETVFCVIGDLSFFYDQNALWNQHLHGNLRILLLNNGQGGIFRQLKGLEKSAVCDSFVAGQHQTTAKGICLQSHVDYQQADADRLEEGIKWLVEADATRPRLLEVATDAADDAAVFKEYYQQAKEAIITQHPSPNTHHPTPNTQHPTPERD